MLASFDLEAVVAVLDSLQQLLAQLLAAAVARKVDLVRACVHVGQVVLVGFGVELECDRVLEAAARECGQRGRPLEQMQSLLAAERELVRLVLDDLPQ
eukprot:419255-Prymnesium_polylepis.1